MHAINFWHGNADMPTMKAVTDRLASDPDLRNLRRRLEDGTYQVASEEVAEALMAWHMSFDQLLRRARRRTQGPPDGLVSENADSSRDRLILETD
ncbi:MAG: flagellar biosynthesis anti-sigma factor FlgM [Actinobacteria bacterium]|nr:flagellar biosynthesis anti-sigma factor FlgM [Actinomycetota bacterium]